MISIFNIVDVLNDRYKGKSNVAVIYSFNFSARNRLARELEIILKSNISIRQEGIIEINISQLDNGLRKDLIKVLNKLGCKYKIY